MKGVVDWINEIKQSESFAKKFQGRKTVSEIIALAKKNGYEFSERELKDLDLNSISGGNLIDVKTFIQQATVSTVVTGDGSTGVTSPTITFNATNNK